MIAHGVVKLENELIILKLEIEGIITTKLNGLLGKFGVNLSCILAIFEIMRYREQKNSQARV